MIENKFQDIPRYLDDFFSEQFEGRLLLSKNISKVFEDNSESISFEDLSENLRKSINLDKLRINEEELFSNQLYLLFPSKNDLQPLLSFFFYSEQQYYHLSQMEKNGVPIYSNIFTSESKLVKQNTGAFTKLIEEELGFLAPEIKFKLTRENGIFHNMPEPTYQRFIGRNDSINTIVKALKHRRILFWTFGE